MDRDFQGPESLLNASTRCLEHLSDFPFRSKVGSRFPLCGVQEIVHILEEPIAGPVSDRLVESGEKRRQAGYRVFFNAAHAMTLPVVEAQAAGSTSRQLQRSGTHRPDALLGELLPGVHTTILQDVRAVEDLLLSHRAPAERPIEGQVVQRSGDLVVEPFGEAIQIPRLLLTVGLRLPKDRAIGTARLGSGAEYLGQAELTPGGTGWRTVSFESQLMALFSTELEDASFGIAINTEPGAPPVLLDNLRFSGSLPVPAPTSIFDFEGGTSGVDQSSGSVSSVAISSAQAFDGVQSLAVNLNGSAAGQVWAIPTASPGPGTTVSVSVFIPPGAPVMAVSPYVMDQNWTWTDSWNDALPQGQWVTLSVTVPASAVLTLNQLGVKFYLNGSYDGPVYVDAIDW